MLSRITQILVPLLALILLPWGVWVTHSIRRLDLRRPEVSDLQNVVQLINAAQSNANPAPSSVGPVSIIGNDKVEVGLIRKGNTLLSAAIIDRSTGFNWVVQNSTAGPWLLAGEDIFWEDQSAKHNNAFAAAGRPAIASSTFPKGDMPVVRFHGNDYFTLADSAQLRLPQFSVCAVINVKGSKEPTVPTTMQTYYSSVNPQNLGNGMILQVTPDRKVYFFTSGAQDNPDGKGNLHNRALYDPMMSTSAVSEGWHIITATYDGAGKNIYADGINIGSSTAKAINYENNTVASIGALREYEAWFKSEIAEIVVYDTVDVAQRAAVETYLSDKYGIVVPTHSYSQNTGKPVLWLKADAGVTVGGKNGVLAGLNEASGMRFLKESRTKTAQGGQELKTEWQGAKGLKLDWIVRSFPNTSVVEYQARLENTGSTPITKIREFGPISLRLRGDLGNLKVHWLRRDQYAKIEQYLTDDKPLLINGGTWNAPQSAGWVALENENMHEILFLGIQWESSWRIGFQKHGTEVSLEVTLADFVRDIAPGKEMFSPKVFLGVSHGDIDDSLRDRNDYLQKYVMPQRLPQSPWVTYNIWGTSGDGSDETAILNEIPFAASLGIDLFYIDASWYEGSCKDGSGSWFTGLGNWHSEDFQKYPHGLANISKRVHEAGMKFGLWFAPQMVESSLIGGRIPESWVAKRDGKHLVTVAGTNWPMITQICMGDREVIEFLKKSMASAVGKYNLEWIKWDNSGLPGRACNSPDHGHQAGDGHIAAIEGEYEIWNYLHTQFPNLILEQCGYPSRVDYGLAPYLRSNWLSDSSDNPTHVRRNILNCSYVYPAGCLEAWVYKGTETDKEDDPRILDTTMRSRMIGHPGFGMAVKDLNGVERVSLYPKVAIEAAKRNIANYKKYRHLLYEDVYHLPPPSTASNQWDAVQFCKRDGSESVAMWFCGGSPKAEMALALRGLTPDAHYTITSLNNGTSDKAIGSKLMSDGVHVSFAKAGMSEILLLKRD